MMKQEQITGSYNPVTPEVAPTSQSALIMKGQSLENMAVTGKNENQSSPAGSKYMLSVNLYFF